MARGISLLFALAILVGAHPAEAVKVRVRGSAAIEARAILNESGLEVQGRLDDDAGRPVPATHIRLRLLAAAQGPALELPPPEPCPPTQVEQLHVARGDPARPDEYVVDTDGAGAFCVRARGVATGTAVELKFEGNEFYPPETATVSIEAGRRMTVLAFSPEPRRLALERPRHGVWIEAHVEPPLGADEPREALQLELGFTGRGEAHKILSRASVRPGERVELEFASRDLGAPGPGTLIARYAGSTTLQPSERSAVVLRSARVVLGLSGKLVAADPEDGIQIPVAVGSALGAVPSGSVEARLGASSVGMAPVRAGAATVLARFQQPRTPDVELELIYVPREPWWTSGDPLSVRAPLAPPSAWRSVPWMIAAAAVLLWFVGAWRRPARTDRARHEREAAAPSGRPSLEVVERGPARSGWRGRVLDAHEGEPISGARVQVLVPAFAGDGVAREATTDERGAFEMPHVDEASAEGTRMRVTARWHTALTRPMPPAGFVSIQLVSRRRALLERLVEWARQRGAGWEGTTEPTPGEVMRRARRKHEPAIATWAEMVEQAAYGPEAPDEPKENAVREREPSFRE